MPKSLRASREPQGAAGWNHFRAWEACLAEQAVQGNRGQTGQKEEKATELCAERTGGKIELADISDGGAGGARPWRSLLVEPSGETAEALSLQEDGDGGRAEGVSLVVESAADVVDGEVLFAQGNDPGAKAILLGSGLWSFGG